MPIQNQPQDILDELWSQKLWSVHPVFFSQVSKRIPHWLSGDKDLSKIPVPAQFQVKPNLVASAYYGMDAEVIIDDDRPYVIVNGAALIQVRGAMMPFGYCNRGTHSLVNLTKQAADDPDVLGIVFQVNTPGGSPTGIQSLYNAISDCKKHTAAHVCYNMHSAGMNAFASVDRIFVDNLDHTSMGSIGVYMVHTDWSQYSKEMGVKYTYIVSEGSPDKVRGHPDKPLSDEDYKFLRSQANELYDSFVSDVQKGRQKSFDNAVFSGQSFTGRQAIANGLADEVGDIRAAIDFVTGGNEATQPGAVYIV